MRRSTAIFLFANFLLVIYLVNSVKTLLFLLVQDGASDAIHRSDIPAPGSELIDARPQLIPKIIHQTYINTSIPLVWQAAQKSCVDLHSDYEYKVRATRRTLTRQLSANLANSSGRTRHQGSSLLLSIPGSWRPLTNIPTQSSAPMPFVISSLRFMVEFTSTLTMDATAVLIHSSHIRHGYVAQSQLVFLTMRWERYLSIHSSYV